MKKEYVIIAVVIALAVTIFFYFFGRTIFGWSGVAASATSDHSAGAAAVQESRCSADEMKATRSACEKFSAAESACEAAAPCSKARSSHAVRSAEVDVPGSDDPDGRGRSRNADR